MPTSSQKTSFLPFLIGSSLLISACGGGSVEDPPKLDPRIDTPGRSDVAIEVTAPSGFYPIRTLTQDEGSSLVDLFLSYGFDFASLEDLSKYFVASAGDLINYNMQLDELMVAQSYNPDQEQYLHGLIGFHNPDTFQAPDQYIIDPVSQALYTLVVDSGMTVDIDSGLTDEYQSIDPSTLKNEIGRVQLMLEGLTQNQIDIASDIELDQAADRAFVQFASASDHYQSFVYHFLNQSTWHDASQSMSLTFGSQTLTYIDGSGTSYSGTYTAQENNGIEITATFDTLGEIVTTVSEDAAGSYITFLSTRLNQQ